MNTSPAPSLTISLGLLLVFCLTTGNVLRLCPERSPRPTTSTSKNAGFAVLDMLIFNRDESSRRTLARAVEQLLPLSSLLLRRQLRSRMTSGGLASHSAVRIPDAYGKPRATLRRAAQAVHPCRLVLAKLQGALSAESDEMYARMPAFRSASPRPGGRRFRSRLPRRGAQDRPSQCNCPLLDGPSATLSPPPSPHAIYRPLDRARITRPPMTPRANRFPASLSKSGLLQSKPRRPDRKSGSRTTSCIALVAGPRPAGTFRARRPRR